MEIVERAEELYCVDGQTFDAIATLTGVAASSLKRWSERYNWQEKKEQIRQARSSIRTNAIMLRAKLLEKCLTTLEPKDAFAVSSIENVSMKAQELAAKAQNAAQAFQNSDKVREIKTDAEAIAALEEAVQIKINRMLSNPGQITAASIKELSQIRATIAEMRGAMEEAQSEKIDSSGMKKLAPETLKKIREQIYGV